MTAEDIRNQLANGGVVQVTTYLRSWLYDSRHVESFREKKGRIQVRNGREWSNLSMSNGTLLVGIRFGNYK